MEAFLNQRIPDEYVFINYPECRTRKEAAERFVLDKNVSEPTPPLNHGDEILHRIYTPQSANRITDRQIVLQHDGKIRKSIRLGHSSLLAEKNYLGIVKAETSLFLPHVYRTAEFETIVMEKLPGITLEQAWPTLFPKEIESMADQVVEMIQQMRRVESPAIQAPFVKRKLFEEKPKNVLDFNLARFKGFIDDELIFQYVHSRSIAFIDQRSVLTHGDLDRSNVMVSEKKVVGLIDFESGGYFPAYWEWMLVKSLLESQPQNAWVELLEERLGKAKTPAWDAMWEIEKLHSALENYTSWRLTPEDREAARETGWAEVCKILGCDSDPIPFVYDSSKIPFFLDFAQSSPGKV